MLEQFSLPEVCCPKDTEISAISKHGQTREHSLLPVRTAYYKGVTCKVRTAIDRRPCYLPCADTHTQEE